ncbi:MAG: hypothetical protein K2O01_08645, partial [Bacteroidales bacterium]|nr:hypothetical protein [Bacteroidales bacterium]
PSHTATAPLSVTPSPPFFSFEAAKVPAPEMPRKNITKPSYYFSIFGRFGAILGSKTERNEPETMTENRRKATG